MFLSNTRRPHQNSVKITHVLDDFVHCSRIIIHCEEAQDRVFGEDNQ